MKPKRKQACLAARYTEASRPFWLSVGGMALKAKVLWCASTMA
jgi:hypothetical protein